MRSDYRTEIFQKVSVCGIPCDFSDMRIDGSTVPEGRYQYEVAGDDDSGGDPQEYSEGYWSISLERWSVMCRCLLGVMVYCGCMMAILYICRNRERYALCQQQSNIHLSNVR